MTPKPGRVDAHHHMWQLDHRAQPWIDPSSVIHRDFTFDDLRPLAAAAGISATVFVQTVGEPTETPEVLALAENDELVAGVVGWADLLAPDLADTLASLRSGPGGHRLVGLRHGVQSEPDERWLCRPEVRRGLRAIADAGLRFDLLTKPVQLPAAIETVAALPELTFVVDHISKPPIASGVTEPWARTIRQLAALENVVCKLSGMVTEADHAKWTVADLVPYVDIVLDAFGPDRLMFGSDWPVCLLAASYEQVVDAAEQLTSALSTAESDAIFGGTARRVYQLDTLL